MTLSLSKLQECAERAKQTDGKPCNQQNSCIHHLTNPCEGCGRIGGRTIVASPEEVLALIMVAKLAKEYRYYELKEALKEIEL